MGPLKIQDSALVQGLRKRVDLTAAPPGGWATRVDRRSGLSVEAFAAEYLIPRQPVILTDAAAAQGWQALGWTPASLKAKLGDRLIPLGKEQVKFGAFIDRMLNDPSAPYLANIDIPKYFPELMADIRPPLTYAIHNRLNSGLLPPNFPTRRDEKLFVTFFVGPRGRKYGLHYDFHNVHTFITQLHGTKEVRFYSPDQTPLMYPNAERPKVSDVGDAWDADTSRYPLFRDARPLDLVASPGETLFVPAGWWHATRLGDQCISVGESFVHEANWMHFVRDIAETGSPSVAKRVAAATYLLGAGALMSLEERLPLPKTLTKLLSAVRAPSGRLGPS